MADGKTPASYDYNVGITRKVVEMAHWAGVSVEGELGVLGLESGMGEKEDGHELRACSATTSCSPIPTRRYSCAAPRSTPWPSPWAPRMGPMFSRRPDGAVLAMSVIEEIHRRLPNTHLIKVHGSSSSRRRCRT